MKMTAMITNAIPTVASGCICISITKVMSFAG